MGPNLRFAQHLQHGCRDYCDVIHPPTHVISISRRGFSSHLSVVVHSGHGSFLEHGFQARVGVLLQKMQSAEDAAEKKAAKAAKGGTPKKEEPIATGEPSGAMLQPKSSVKPRNSTPRDLHSRKKDTTVVEATDSASKRAARGKKREAAVVHVPAKRPRRACTQS